MYAKLLSHLIAKHPVNKHSVADNTQLNTSATSCSIDRAIKSIQCCTSGIQGWMIGNKLQLNEDKTEALLVAASSCDKALPAAIQKGSNAVPFVKSVQNLAVTLDIKLSMKEQRNRK